MNNINKQNIDFYKKYQEIKYDMSKANLEDIKNILDHYNQGAVTVNGVNYHYNINPLEAACLNARYKELTGEDHPTFIKEQKKVLDEIIKSGKGINVDGKPTIYQRLKNNLTGEGLGITILPNKKDSYINKYDTIKFDMSKASLKDIKDILDHYDQDSVLIDGIQNFFKLNPLEAASLNARYKELTGEDHPIFIKVQKEALKQKNKNNEGLIINGRPTIYEQLANGTIEIGDNNHIIKRMSKILDHLDNASLEDVSKILDYYNGAPVIINGIANHPFNDPVLASKINDRYRDLTGEDHPTYLEQVPIVIDDLIQNKNLLISEGVYDNSYYDKLDKILEETESYKKKSR